MLTLVPGGMDADAARTDASAESVYSYTVIRARGRGSLPAAPNFELPLLLSSAPGDGSTQVFKFTHTARAAAAAPPRPRAREHRAQQSQHTRSGRGEGECSVLHLNSLDRLKDHAGCRSIRAEYDLYGRVACVRYTVESRARATGCLRETSPR